MHFFVKLVCAAPCSFCAAAWSLQHFLAKLVSAAPCKLLPVACILQLSSASAAVATRHNVAATIAQIVSVDLPGQDTHEEKTLRALLRCFEHTVR